MMVSGKLLLMSLFLKLVLNAESVPMTNGEKTIVSFNADLYPAACNVFDPTDTKCESYEKRSDKIAYAIQNDLPDTDVLCLQGIFFDEDEKKIIHNTREKFPYSYSFTHNEDGEFNEKKHFPAPCSQQDLPGLNQINDCSDHNCHSKADYIELIACMEDHCRATQDKKSIRDVFADLSDTCVGCIFSGTKRNVFDCLNEKYAFNPTGLVLLSKLKITSYNSQYFPHDHEVIRHGYLDVEIDTIGRVICTVMQPYIGKAYIDITGGAPSYEDKNLNEAKTLVAVTDSSNSVIIAGCLNTESILSKGAITPQFPPSMGVFKTAGFLDPISDSYYSSYPSCTFCFSNHYVKEAYKHQYYDGYILDHVLVRGYRVLNSGTSHEQGQNKFVTRVLMSEEGNPQKPLSAHYGVSVTFSDD